MNRISDLIRRLRNSSVIVPKDVENAMKRVSVEDFTDFETEGFYNDRSLDLALPTQLYFLLHRTRKVAEIPKNDLLGPTLITDFIAEKDRIFAEATLDANELALYNQISEALFKKGPSPDLVIYLQASVPTLKKRIQSRGIGFEQSIETDYLENLVERYTEFFHQYFKNLWDVLLMKQRK